MLGWRLKRASLRRTGAVLLLFAVWGGASAQKVVSSTGIPVPQGWLNIAAVGPNVVRVTVSQTKSVPVSPLPVVIGEDHQATERVSLTNPTVVRLDGLTVLVAKDGTLSFFDLAGNLLAQELASKRQLQPFRLPGFANEAAFHAQATFTLKPNEHLYGLGQHQDGALDRHGTQTLLSQDNREVAIPWLVSTKGYGILWNNASRTLVDAAGKPNLAELADDQQVAGGLTGHYFDGKNFEKLVNVRRDAGVNFDWTAKPPPNLGHDNYSVRWTGTFVPQSSGPYRFTATADDGVRLFIDNKPVLDDWSVHAARAAQATVKFVAHSRHAVRLEFFQATRDSIINFAWTRPGANSVCWSSYAAKGIDYYFVVGPSMDTLLASLRTLTGAAPMPPKWALGYWQSKERYATEAEWMEIAEGYRSRHLPIDNLVQDWFYWDPHAWGSHQFDAKRYPDPAAGIAELHDNYHLHFMISVWGKFAPGSAADPDLNYQELQRNRSLYPENVSSPEQYYDAFSPEARSTYWRQMRSELFNKGVDAWWLDASEPEANLNALNATQTGLGPGAFVVSGWPLMHTTGVYQGQRAANPDKRVFILTRSGYAGQQRNGAAIWSGDIAASWDTLARQIPAGLNIGVSGIPYWTTDIGAFFVPYRGGCDNPEYRELYTRWFEFGAFCPIFRSHGTDTPREMWRFGSGVEQILKKYDRLRYRLLPYIYSQAWQVTAHGASLMKPLASDFQNDDLACEIDNEFLFGPALLICPVTKPQATSTRVYLPSGANWVDFWTGKALKGGSWIVADAPLDREPIYVRSGSVLPMGPDLEYTNEHPADPIDLVIYPGESSNFVLYEDAGDGYGYEKGERAEIPIHWDDRNKTIELGQRKGSFPGMLTSRRFRIVLVTEKHGLGASPAMQVPAIVTYVGHTVRFEAKELVP